MRKNSAKELSKDKYENLFFKKYSLTYLSVDIKKTLKIEILGKDTIANGEYKAIGTASLTFFEQNRPKT